MDVVLNDHAENVAVPLVRFVPSLLYFLRAEEDGYNECSICPAETSPVLEYRSYIIHSAFDGTVRRL